MGGVFHLRARNRATLRASLAVPSTVIRRYQYSPERRELLVTFQSGRSYVYHDVPAATYTALKQAFSKGEFFNTNIRDCFSFTRQSG
jgi:lysyl-tRNA synthetase class 2